MSALRNPILRAILLLKHSKSDLDEMEKNQEHLRKNTAYECSKVLLDLDVINSTQEATVNAELWFDNGYSISMMKNMTRIMKSAHEKARQKGL